ncbi:unnamed protein product [Adineta steineri]|uniref:Uncharacterized protein n=1 Tax=Adineta steineri TaxID=433720 RepID=A0A814GAM7_9BILA|nr:unnamed protein product [Adineta steineri]CAF1162211.1 unnamed protein product [Adineta steineri]
MTQQTNLNNDDFEILYDTSPMNIQKPSDSINLPNEEKSITINNQSKPVNSSYLPIRYGSAANIPYKSDFDLESIVDNNVQKYPTVNNINELLIQHVHDRNNLIQLAKQTQQDFIKAIHLD